MIGLVEDFEPYFQIWFGCLREKKRESCELRKEEEEEQDQGGGAREKYQAL